MPAKPAEVKAQEVRTEQPKPEAVKPQEMKTESPAAPVRQESAS